MLTLFLLRHAKSSWRDDSLSDFDRPLAGRGLKAAPMIGAHMAECGFAPQKVLCSSSQRTRETLGLVLPRLAGACEITLTREVYEADDDTDLMTLIAREEADTIQRLMLIGHNPAMQDLALSLTGQGAPEDRAAIAEKFPTAALAVLTFDAAEGWGGIAPGTGLLTHFIRPKELD